MSGRVSWRPDPRYGQRQFGTFIRWRHGIAVVRHGAKLVYLAPSELTWEGQ